MSYRLSVIICTHNPRKDLLAWTLSSLAAQSFPDEQRELLVVDNASAPPLDEAALRSECGIPGLRVIVESEPGLTRARCAGIRATTAPVLVFVDDDNYLAADYLAQADRTATNEPHLGAWGGIAEPKFEIEPPGWVRPILPNLGIRNYGSDPISSTSEDWGPWEPIGAGMVCRRSVAESFVAMAEQSSVIRTLGRTGKQLLSAEDSVFARCSNQLGFANGYRPDLRLQHFIKDQRISIPYLAGLMRGHGISFARMRRHLGRPLESPEPGKAAAQLLETFRFRVREMHDAGYLQWYWDVGALEETAPIAWPKISIVVPTFNAEAALRRCLVSLQAQHYPNLEVILADGDSKDGTLRIASEFGNLVSVVISERDKGQADALNKGFARATGEILGWLCADDELKPGALLVAALCFLDNPATDWVVGACLRVFPDGSTWANHPPATTARRLGYHNHVDQPASFWRARLHRRAGLIATHFHFAFDWEWWNRLARAGGVPLVVPDILAVYHFSDNNKTSVGGTRATRELFRIVRKYGPARGLLAYAYWMLYHVFDLRGCYDRPPVAEPRWMERHARVLRWFVKWFGEEPVYAYNWNYASKQQRGLCWYK